jgi:serine/threonine-protein kinase
MPPVETPVSTRAKRPVVAFGAFTFDPGNQLLRRDGVEVPLPPRVLGVLEVLLDRAGDLVPRQQLVEGVWKDAFVTDTSLAEAISVLRQALGDDPQAPVYIQTIHRRGYRFVAPVTPQPIPAQAALTPAVDARIAADTPDSLGPSIGRSLLPWSLAALCALLAIVAVWQSTQREGGFPVETRFAIELPQGTRFAPDGVAVALSPDGSALVWSGCDGSGCRLYLRPLARLEPSPVPGTEGAVDPFFSPDGEWVGFFADGKLKKVALAGGSPAAIADVTQPLGAVWARDGRIIYGSSIAAGLSQVPASGGTPEPLTVPRQQDGEVRHAWPALDGTRLFFSVATSLDGDGPFRLASATLEGRRALTRWSTLLEDVSIARPLSADLLVVGRGNELQVVGFDPARGVLAGVPQTVVPSVALVRGLTQFAVSRSGSLVYLGLPASAAAPRNLAWWTGRGFEPAVEGLEDATAPALSPDGRRIAWPSLPGGRRADLWTGDLQRGAAARLTHDGLNFSPTWSADGARVFFSRADQGILRLASIGSEGGAMAMLADRPHHAFPQSVSADGSLLAFVELNDRTRADIWLLPLSGGAPRAAVQSAFDDLTPALSRDATLLAYQSDEGGRWDVYVQRVGDGRRAIVSTAGGERPFWASDRSALYYRAGARLLRVPISPNLSIGSPETVMELGDSVAIGEAPDGRLLVERRTVTASTSAVVVLHWDREARMAAGARGATLIR